MFEETTNSHSTEAAPLDQLHRELHHFLPLARTVTWGGWGQEQETEVSYSNHGRVPPSNVSTVTLEPFLGGF